MNTAFAQNTANEVASGTASELANLIQLILTKIPLWIAGFIVIVISFLLAKIARRIVENKLAEKGIEEEHKELQILGGRMANTTVLLIGVTVGLKIAGIDLTTILAAVAFGIGFALKDLIMNFLAGVFILIGRHFTIGDFIKVGNTIGKVKEIQSRVTILQAIDGTKVIVPNADMFKKQVISFTSNPFRRIEVVVGVDYRNNIENVLKITMDTVKSTKGILLEPKPAVLVNDFGDSGISIKIKAWVNSKGGWVKIKSRLAKNLKITFDKYGIVIPWPIRTVVEDKEKQISEKIFEENNTASNETEPTPQTTPEPQQSQIAPPQTTPQNLAPETQTSDEFEQPLKPLGEQ